MLSASLNLILLWALGGHLIRKYWQRQRIGLCQISGRQSSGSRPTGKSQPGNKNKDFVTQLACRRDDRTQDLQVENNEPKKEQKNSWRHKNIIIT